jgi:hypothetical protein
VSRADHPTGPPDEPAPLVDREAAIGRIIDSAAAMGIEIDRAEAEDWVAAMASEALGGTITVDVASGVYGHRVSMADHSPERLARFREMAPIVGIPDRPPVVTTALALSGSAAQGKIQRFPADADFFERVHIRADSREEACRILGDLIREKALATLTGPGYRLWEVKWGTWPADAVVSGAAVRRGHWVSWTSAQVVEGSIPYQLPDGSISRFRWEDGLNDPGWCKLDWLISDRERGVLANASNVLDPTWEGPDGEIVPLDGFLEPYFQEVYLETESIPLFTRLVKDIGGDAVDRYVGQLEDEIHHYTVEDPNYGKAARRLYNVFRLTGRYPEAAYLRELFDEPVTALYQVAALLRTLDDAAESGDAFEAETMLAQVDQLIMAAIGALEGHAEDHMVGRLLRLREALAHGRDRASRRADLDRARAAAFEAVNDYFRRALLAVPTIREYLAGIAARVG